MAISTNDENKQSVIKSLFQRIIQIDEISIFISLIVIGILLSLLTEEFSNPANLIQVLRQTAYVGTMAVGMVFVISQGDIDISVAAIYNLSVIIMAYALRGGFSPDLIIPFGILIGCLLGLANGVLMITLKLPAMIVTLGTATIFKGLSLVISKATTIAGFPNKEHWFFQVFGGKISDFLHASSIIMIVVAILGYLLFNHTAFGRHVCAVGANKQAAKYAGIRVDRTRLITMMLNGVIAAISGMGTLAFLGAADPSFGSGSEMNVIASAIIGGTSLSGGTGSIFGALIGALIITVIRNGLVLLRVSIYWQGVFTGATILAAVGLDYVIKRRRS